jgi:hypothetical protein
LVGKDFSIIVETLHSIAYTAQSLERYLFEISLIGEKILSQYYS